MTSNPASAVQQGKQRAASSAVENQARQMQTRTSGDDAEDTGSGSDSSFEEADDQDWGDWVDDEDDEGHEAAGFKVSTWALFPDLPGSNELRQFADAQAALAHAKSLGCDLVAVVAKLGLDPLQVIRVLNHLRRNPGKLSPKDVSHLNGDEAFLEDDEELMPVKGAEQDGLLQIDFDELIEAQAHTGQASSSQPAGDSSRKKIEDLESQLLTLQIAYADLRKRSLAKLGLAEDADQGDPGISSRGGQASKSAFAIASEQMKGPEGRDDDTHYFDSYAGHDIHQIMISDTSRTYSYAKFIMSPQNAHLFRGKRIMDIGCGSGILSMFAARAGAKEVIAVDASDVAHRAEANIRENMMDHIIKVVKGKLENLKEELESYEGKIDVIISEWMGYFLLYESMLPSVLHARDLYLRKEVSAENPHPALLAPSHCRMTLAAVSDSELLHQRVHFWNDVHGFKMTAMTKGLFDEAYTEALSPQAVVSDVANIYDLPLCVLPAKQPTFRSNFSLRCNRQAQIHAFVSWFDTWFMTTPEPYRKDPKTGEPIQLEGSEVLDDLPPCTTEELKLDDVPGLKLKGNEIMPELSSASQGEIVSFTTSPFGKETHWKQTVFLLKEPVQAQEGDVISGEIVISQSETNSRELDVELHYMIEGGEADGKKGVKARIAQLFLVR